MTDNPITSSLKPDDLDLHHFAMVGDHEAILDFLAAHDAGCIDQRHARSGWTPLMYAVLGNRAETVGLLLDKGAAVDIGDRNGNTPLGHAVHVRRKEIIAILLDRGADIHRQNGDGATVLSWARENNQAEILALLEEAIEKRSHAGCSPAIEAQLKRLKKFRPAKPALKRSL